MVTRWIGIASLGAGVLFMLVGCMTAAGLPGGTDSTGSAGVVSDVVAKSTSVATGVGGTGGFGGTLMNGYFEHMPARMGFLDQADLATADGGVLVRLHNEADEDCEFHLHYFASHMGLENQVLNVEVGAGEVATVELPCSEIMGVGPLETPGETGCHLLAGEAVPNTMAVPGFLGQDYTCGGLYEHFLTPDVDDLDGDGDTEELVIISGAMQLHLMDGGPIGHMHGHGFGTMGPHMGRF